MNNFDKIQSELEAISNKLDAECSEKAKKAIELFNQCDSGMQSTVIHASGFRGKFGYATLLTHFETMDLMDSLDSCIEDMQDDIDYNKSMEDK